MIPWSLMLICPSKTSEILWVTSGKGCWLETGLLLKRLTHACTLNCSTALLSKAETEKNKRTGWPEFRKPDNKASCRKTTTQKAHSGISEVRRHGNLGNEHGHADSLSTAISQVLPGPFCVGGTLNCQILWKTFSVLFNSFVTARKLSPFWVLRELLWGNSRIAPFQGLSSPWIYASADLGRCTEEILYHSSGLFLISFKIRHKHIFPHQIHRFWNSTFFLPLQ